MQLFTFASNTDEHELLNTGNLHQPREYGEPIDGVKMEKFMKGPICQIKEIQFHDLQHENTNSTLNRTKGRLILSYYSLIENILQNKSKFKFIICKVPQNLIL
jgi:hypothetical protein